MNCSNTLVMMVVNSCIAELSKNTGETNYSDIPGIIIMALDLATKELSQSTGETHKEIKERLILAANQKFKQMSILEVTEWVKVNLPMPSKVEN